MGILLLMTSIYLLQQVSGSTYFNLPKPMTAVEAVAACSNRNSTLAIPESDDVEAIHENRTATGHQLGSWTGQYVDVAPWAFAKVCYGSIDDAPSHTLSNNSGSACLQSCGTGFDTVFVREDQCICYQMESYERYGKAEPYSWCNQECREGGGTCGGKVVYTQYQRCFRQCLPWFHSEHNCMYIDLNGTVVAAPCEDKHFPVCKTGKGTSKEYVLELFVNTTDELKSMSWYDSNQLCREKGGVLADLSERIGSLQGVWKRRILSSPTPTFWIALNRVNTPARNLTEKSSLGNSSQCLFVGKHLEDIRKKNCSEQAFASCRVNLTVTTAQSTFNGSSATDSTTSSIQPTDISIVNYTSQVLSNEMTTQTTYNHSSATASTASDLQPTDNTIGYIVLASVLGAAFVGIIIGMSILMKRRMKSLRRSQHQNRPHYDYTNVGEAQSSNMSGLQMQHVEPSATDASGTGSNIRTRGYETRTLDDGNYNTLDNKSHLKLHSGMSESNTYDSARPILEEEVYNEFQSDRDNSNVRDSFYATSQSCSTTEGNYDRFQQRDLTTGAESDYDHAFHQHA